jgi:hypothetical protein
MDSRERQEKFKKRMYDAGFKQKVVWIPRKSEKASVKMLRKAFTGKLEELTASWPRAKLTRLFNELKKTVEKYAKEGKKKT